MTIYNWIDCLREKKEWSSFSEEERKTFNPFMMNKLLSSNPDLTELVNFIQVRYNVPPQQVYQLYSGFLPSQRVDLHFLKKKKKEESNKELLQILACYFEVSRREIKDYLRILKPRQVEDILISLGYPEKEIKKLLK